MGDLNPRARVRAMAHRLAGGRRAAYVPGMTEAASRLTVYYDGACPVCRREIAQYRGCRGAEAIAWLDAAAAPEALAPDLTRTRALARMHVRGADGRLVEGAAAFAALWRALPAWRILGAAFAARPALWALDRVYDGFLVFRRLWRAPPRSSR
jgi:predicted DCC family thiol-disulfide oxidoreductase YuxK